MEQIEQNTELRSVRGERAEDGGSTFNQVRSTVADKLHLAAQTIHKTAARGNQQNDLSNLGHRAAEWLEHSANYVNDIEPERVRHDLENKVRQNPGRSLLIAGAVGLVLGGLLRRR